MLAVFTVSPLSDLYDHLHLLRVCKTFRQYYEDTGFFQKACLSLGYGLPSAASSQECHSPKSFYEVVSALCAAERERRSDRIEDMGGMGKAAGSESVALIGADASLFHSRADTRSCLTSQQRDPSSPN